MIFETLKNSISIFTLRDVFDILVVSVVVYQILLLTKNTRAFLLLRGLVALLFLSGITTWMGLSATSWLLNRALYAGSFLIIVIFQPEIRRGLEHLGRGRLLNKKNQGEILFTDDEKIVNDLVTAMDNMSDRRVGALIIIQRLTGLKNIVVTGTRIDGRVSAALLEQIFEPNTPLHDGAVIINDSTILAAGCILPLTEEQNISKQLGTRHRAAIGISEVSDCLALVVSEETGAISVAQESELRRDLTSEQLREILIQQYNVLPGKHPWWQWWKNKENNK